MKKKERALFFERLKALNPHPTTELQYHSHFELLIAVMLSAQATDRSVNQATEQLFPIAGTPEAIAALGVEGLEPYIRKIGLYHTKARHIIQTCHLLIEKYHAQVPHDRASLESLPGVGRKTASVVLNTAFGELAMPVDTHIFRVANRTGLASGKTPREVEDQLLQNIDKAYLKDAHHWLVLHGRYICTARNPKCSICPVNDLCAYYTGFKKVNKKIAV